MEKQQIPPPMPPQPAAAQADPHCLFSGPSQIPSLYSTPPGLGFPSLISGSENGVVPVFDLENLREGNSVNKRRVWSSKKTIMSPRFAFETRSEQDILDDGYRWRKYGQKSVKNSKFPRSYYRCTHHTCNVKKQVQRLNKDNSIVVTTYEGIHNHPCEKLMETLTPLLKQIQLLTSATTTNL